MIRDFTFCVLAYNHSDHIIEHLESIKYQINNYGGNIDYNLIVNDDASSDDTVSLVEDWLTHNDNIFNKVDKIFNKTNLGTCQSVVNIANILGTQYCKITAADDVYTQNNIFEFVSNNPSFSLVTGVPVRLVDGKVKISFFEIFNYFASDYIYKKKPLLNRLANVSIVNAPNLFYSTEYLKNPDLMNFLNKYDVVEDWPLQVSIAKTDTQVKLVATKTPVVLYRRTSGSTYLVASKRFVKDQVQLFDYLIDLYGKRGDRLQAFLLRNRRYLFLKKSRLLKSLFNVSRFIYLLKLFYYLPFIAWDYKKFKININDYQEYYDEIQSNAKRFENKIL